MAYNTSARACSAPLKYLLGGLLVSMGGATLFALNPGIVQSLDVSDLILTITLGIMMLALAVRHAATSRPTHTADAKLPDPHAPEIHSLSSVFLSQDHKSNISLDSEMQHEFRTPLNQLTGAADLLKQSPLNNEQIACVNLIQNAAGQMLGVMEKMMSCPLSGDRETWAREAFNDTEREMIALFAKNQQTNLRSSLHILIAEDDRVSMEILVSLLKSLGCTSVDRAANGVEAVEACKRSTYQLIIMDCMMPEMDGYDASAAIRTLPGYGNTPILALTASLAQHEKEHALASGMSEYYAKPITRDTLEYMLSRVNAATAGHMAT